MNRHEHYDAAEASINRAKTLLGRSLDGGTATAEDVSEAVLEMAKISLQLAQTHAILATVPIL